MLSNQEPKGSRRHEGVVGVPPEPEIEVVTCDC